MDVASLGLVKVKIDCYEYYIKYNDIYNIYKDNVTTQSLKLIQVCNI